MTKLLAAVLLTILLASPVWSEQRYNPHSGEWETVPAGSDWTTQYNPHDGSWSYQPREARTEYNPHEGRWDWNSGHNPEGDGD